MLHIIISGFTLGEYVTFLRFLKQHRALDSSNTILFNIFKSTLAIEVPLTQVTKKRNYDNVVWTIDCERAYKEALLLSPVLVVIQHTSYRAESWSYIHT